MSWRPTATASAVPAAMALQHRSTQRKPSTRNPRTEVRRRMHEIVATRTRYGYRRLHVMLKRADWPFGPSVVYRLYREEGSALRTKRPRRCKMALRDLPPSLTTGLNHCR